MWGMRATIIRAAGIAALALGFQALRWLIRKKDDDEDDIVIGSPLQSSQIKELELSPVRQRSPESQRDYGHESPRPLPQHEPESTVRPVEAVKTLRFQEPLEILSDSESRQEVASPLEGSMRYSHGDDDASSSGSGSSWRDVADGQAVIHTPSQKNQSEKSLFTPRFSFPEVDYVPEKSPFDLGSPKNRWAAQNGHAEDGEQLGRHSRHAGFSDHEPEGRQHLSSSSRASSMGMAPAPTEEGDAISKVEEALADLEEQAVKRHSRSFSEPNLAFESQQQQEHPRLGDRYTDEDEEASSPSMSPLADTSIQPSSTDATSNGTTPRHADLPPMSSKRLRDESEESPPLLRLEIISGPSSGRDLTVDDVSQQVTIGRTADNVLTIDDNEVSGQHVALLWEPRSRCWQARDLGSLNGTRLNGNFINNSIRKPGKVSRLNSDDILLLGSRTAIKVVYLPNASMPDFPQNLKRVFAPPSLLQPTTTLRSEAMASLRAEIGIEKVFQADSLRLGGAVLCRLGVEHQRVGKACEDVPFWGEPGRYQAALYCVFDGHCGRKTAVQCTQLLPEELRKRMPDIKADLDAARGVGSSWNDVFLAVDAALDTEDGSTATAVLVWKDAEGCICIQTANVGDSAAVFCNSGADPRREFQKLTKDHRISDADEKRRLADLGIELGKNRTRLYGLNLSRCLGDKFIKGADLGFIAVPHVSEVVRLGAGEGGLLVVASDGLWDFAEPATVMELAFEAQKQPNANPEAVADAIYQHAMKQRSRDDVCVFVLDFRPEGAAPPS